MLKLSNLTKTFRTDEVETTALDAVNIEIKDGEFVAIMGPSGCGKSTLLNIIGMLDTPSAGSYLFKGEEISTYNEAKLADLRKQNLGFIFQSFNLIDELSVFENIELALLYHDVPAKERRERVAAVMEKVGIAHRASHKPAQLSGGQQQRVAVARAVVSSPSLILADEPTGNLDSQHGAEVMALLRQLNKEGTTVVMVTHSRTDAGHAGRVINVLDGRVVAEGLRPEGDVVSRPFKSVAA
ncbi:MAG: ABC transporter ATP-binding protein [Proteobacteria bacterium]|nr:ABC transporter ATP-binding protein [Pseudomonadota bacterium]